uniref:BRD4 interacting chromatin remodeling complex associated protein n=1 Tax=Sinocyclocheilus grahami TaxID=75366 RepID=A0A672PE81_SINGR
ICSLSLSHLLTNEPGLPRVSVDLDFLEDDILGGSPGGDNGSNGVGTNHEPCDILQQSLAEANITEQSLQEADAELDLSQFGLTGLTQVVQPLPDAGLSGVGIGSATQIFPNQGTPTIQPQVMNKAISVQPFVQQVGLGNVTLQPISSLQALPNGSQSGPLGIGQIQVVGQPTVMTINPSGQQILTKTMGGYQLHQPGPEAASAGTQAGNTNTNNSATTMAAAGGIVGFGNASLGAGIGSQTQPQGQIMQNVIIQRMPTPIQPKPPQGGAIQPKVFKQQQQLPAPHALPNDANKALGVQQIPVSAGQNVTFLGKPGSNVVLSTQATSQGTQFSQALFKQQGPQTSGKPLSVHLLNQQGSIVIPSQTVLQSQNHQFLLPGLQAGGQILTQHPGGHIITSQGPGGQIIANQILTANQNINLGQVLASQGHPGAAHILSGHIQLQPGQMGQPTLFQMPVSLAQTQTQAHPVTGHVQTVIQGMPIQNSLSVESLSPAVSLQTLQQSGGIPNNCSSGSTAMAPCQPGEGITVLGGSTDAAAQPAQTQPQPSILTVQTTPQVSVAASVPSSSSPSPTMATSTSSMVGLGPQAQHSPGKVLFTSPGSSMILSQESLQMFLQQVSVLALNLICCLQTTIKIQSASPSQPVVTPAPTPTLTDSPQPAQVSPITIGQQIQSPHQHQQSRPPSQPQSQAQTPSRSCTPSSLPPLFIIHNQIGGSPQPGPPSQQQQQQPQQIQVQLQPQVLPQTLPQPTTLQPDIPPSSCSPKPPQPLPAQFQFQPAVSSPPAAVVKQQVTVVPGLTAEQQHHLQLVSAQLQTMSSITQPSPQQKQLLEKLHLVMHHHLILYIVCFAVCFLKLFSYSHARVSICRMLEQLRKQQGSVLHPDYSSPFRSFEDNLHRLLPYHLYQGMASSPEDYRKVDEEFENVSCQLLKRTQAMVDKYRHLLFEESKRLGPSAEMVMIDRMFIQEEKVALSQDRVLAKEKPEEFVANSCLLDNSAVRPVQVELTAASTPASTPALFPSTKLVIKQGGGGASPVTPSASFSRIPSTRPTDDDDDVALPQRTSKPPIKTYEARQRIGLKLKIKQEAGFSKVVHNTALDPVHSQSQLTPQPPPPEQPQKVKPTHITPLTTSAASTPASTPAL